MTRQLFIAQPPLALSIDGKDYTLTPSIESSGRCVYKSQPLELWVKTSHGKIRVRGRIVLSVADSKHWTNQ